MALPNATERQYGFIQNISRVAVTFARPSNTTPYTAKDVVAPNAGNVLTLDGLGRVPGGGGRIIAARIVSSLKTDTSTYRVHFYHTSPPAIADNSPFTLLIDNALRRVGYVDVGALATEDATNSTMAEGRNLTDWLPFVCAPGDKNLYAMLETLAAYTPISGQQFVLEVLAEVL